MSEPQFNVVCPRCSAKLSIREEIRNKAIACPRCQNKFKLALSASHVSSSIQSHMETRMMEDEDSFDEVVMPAANTLKDSIPKGTSQTISGSKSGVIANESATISSSNVIPVQTDWGATHKNQTRRFKHKYSGLSRAQFYQLARRKKVPLSEKDEVLQSTGMFLILIAAITAFLPLFDLKLGEFESAGIVPAVLSICVVMIGIIMTVIAQRNNPVTALGLGFGMLLMFVVAYIGVFDFFDVANPFRTNDRNEVAAAIENPDAVAGNDGADNPIIAPPKGDPGPAADAIEQNPRKINPTKRDFEFNDGFADEFENERVDAVTPTGNAAENIADKVTTSGKPLTEFAMRSRVRNMNSERLRNGIPESAEFENKYKILIAGDISAGGVALMESAPVAGFDFIARGNRLMTDVAPFSGQPTFETSAFSKDGAKLCGLRCHFKKEQLVGLQPLFEVEGKVMALQSGEWVGEATALGDEGVVVHSSGSDIFGFAIFRTPKHLIGIGIVVKKKS